MQGNRDLTNCFTKVHECSDGRATSVGAQTLNSTRDRNSSSSKGGVGFRMQSEEYQEERKKYLTAKYGSQQMKLIRKRLSVEFWIDEQLKKLYNVQSDTDTYDCELDLDEILDMPDDQQRQQFIWNQVSNSPKPEREVMAFVNELLQKASGL